jgi:hypothetical protein
VAQLVARFNREGLAAAAPRHGRGSAQGYGPEAYARILREVRRTPDREQDGTATWSLTTLQRALRQAPMVCRRSAPIPSVSSCTRQALAASQPHLVRHRPGQAQTQDRGDQSQRPGCRSEKKLIEQAYLLGERLGLAVCTTDQAGLFKPYRTRGRAGNALASPSASRTSTSATAPPSC